MRVRTIVAIASLIVPAVASAQRIPTGRRNPGRPAELPPQPAVIAEQLAYKRSHFTFDSYTFVAHVQSPGFMGNGILPAWNTVGAATRTDYRISQYVSATLDLSSSVVGGPANFQTAELGTRLHPMRSESRFYPFADLRFGYTVAYNSDPRSAIAQAASGFNTVSRADRYSTGWGGVGGIGTEYQLAGSWSLTSGVTVMRNRMTEHGILPQQSDHRSYAMTLYRYTIGVSYNLVRMVRASPGDAR